MTTGSAGRNNDARTRTMSSAPNVAAGRVLQPPMFIIGNKAFFLAAKRAVDAGGGFHIVGAFKYEDLQTSLRRSVLLGQKPMVAVIHEPPGEKAQADEIAHAVLQIYPNCGIVLVSGDELEAAAERRIGAHDFNATVVSESTLRNPKALVQSMRSAMTAAGADGRAA